MSWKIIEKYRRILAAEEGATPKNWGGKLPVCLVYPNSYRTAMSNLGFQSVYALLNADPDTVCERAFLPEKEELKEYEKSRTQLLSLESQRQLSDFSVIAFSVSFESDYLNIPRIFRLAGIPPFAAERDSGHPLVMAGGAALFLNPEPVAEMMDLVCVGEGEALLPPLFAMLKEESGEREGLLRRAATLPGIYVPSLYEVSYDGARVDAISPRPGAPERVERGWTRDIDQHMVRSEIFTPDTEFSGMHLIELSRGCPRGCRFCAAGFIYRPYRQRSLEALKREVDRGLERHERLGLVGAAVSDHRDIGELSRYILEKGGKASVSSLRLDSLDPDLMALLKASGHRTLALAPEGGSQRLRDLVRKNLTEKQILDACEGLIANDILNLKLYFIIGLPSETREDLEELVALTGKIRERVAAAAREKGRLGEVLLSVNPFVPKPFTPLQWCPMEESGSLEEKLAFLRSAIGPMANVRMIAESTKEAYLQALLSRGDRRLARLLVKAEELGKWKRGARELGIDTDLFVHRQIGLEETLPWDVIHSGDRDLLKREYCRAFELPATANLEL